MDSDDSNISDHVGNSYIITVFRSIACFFSEYFQQINKTSPFDMSVLSWPWELSSISESSDVECSLGSPVLGDHNTGIKIIFYTSIVNNTGIKYCECDVIIHKSKIIKNLMPSTKMYDHL
jgi:hypothetical protein